MDSNGGKRRNKILAYMDEFEDDLDEHSGVRTEQQTPPASPLGGDCCPPRKRLLEYMESDDSDGSPDIPPEADTDGRRSPSPEPGEQMSPLREIPRDRGLDAVASADGCSPSAAVALVTTKGKVKDLGSLSAARDQKFDPPSREGNSSHRWGASRQTVMTKEVVKSWAVDNSGQERIFEICGRFKFVQEIDGLQGLCRDLRTLDLSSNNISRITGLRDMVSLRCLRLDSCQIERISGLQECSFLQQLYLSDNRISEVEGLDCVKRLEVLDLARNRISEILPRPLARVCGLKELNLAHNKLKKLPGLSSFRELISLDLSHCSIAALTSADVAGMTSLEELKLSHNELSSLEWLCKQRDRRGVSIPVSTPSSTRAVAVRSAPSRTPSVASSATGTSIGETILPSLSSLNISHNNIVAVDSMPRMPLLTELNLSRNKLVHVRGLAARAPTAEILDLSQNRILDGAELTELESLGSLLELNLSKNGCVVDDPDVTNGILGRLASLELLDEQPVQEFTKAVCALKNSMTSDQWKSLMPAKVIEVGPSRPATAGASRSTDVFNLTSAAVPVRPVSAGGRPKTPQTNESGALAVRAPLMHANVVMHKRKCMEVVEVDAWEKRMLGQLQEAEGLVTEAVAGVAQHFELMDAHIRWVKSVFDKEAQLRAQRAAAPLEPELPPGDYDINAIAPLPPPDPVKPRKPRVKRIAEAQAFAADAEPIAEEVATPASISPPASPPSCSSPMRPAPPTVSTIAEASRPAIASHPVPKKATAKPERRSRVSGDTTCSRAHRHTKLCIR
mmetsp:Transcript_2469/g.5551  ORF Transcript_2469/g.5551 Transcript_2469/m.5551 type:complete len:791 (+) Transcript_2469:35-2407(+)